jgi:hypothetical protein
MLCRESVPAPSTRIEPWTSDESITSSYWFPSISLLSQVYFLPAYDWGIHSEPSRLQVTSKFRLGQGVKIPSSCELGRVESLGGCRGPRSLVLLGLAPRRRQGNIILVCMETSNRLFSLTFCIFCKLVYDCLYCILFNLCVTIYDFFGICIFVVCTNRLICGAQHSKADIAERGRPAVISMGPQKAPPV